VRGLAKVLGLILALATITLAGVQVAGEPPVASQAAPASVSGLGPGAAPAYKPPHSPSFPVAGAVSNGSGVVVNNGLAEPGGHVLGDVDCYGGITAIDALHILRYNVDLRPYSPCIGVGDVNCDGSTDAVDALGALRVVAQLSALPAPPFCSELSRAIAAETASQASSGWDIACPGWYHELSDVVGSFDNTNYHRVAVYCHETAPYDVVDKVVISELQGQQLVPLLTFDEPVGNSTMGVHFDLEFPEDGRLPVLRDIQGDAVNELVVAQYASGNCWECYRLRAFAGKDHRVYEVPVRLPATGLLGSDYNGDGTSAVPRRLADIDGDGLMEVLALDASWELNGFCHACSPGAWFILAWNGAEYVDASREARFQPWFDQQIAAVEERLTGAQSDEPRLSAAIEITLLYGRSGRAAQGWKRFDAIVPGLETDCWRNAAPAYEQHLELSVPRSGEAPTTSIHGPGDLPFCPYLVRSKARLLLLRSQESTFQ